MEDKVWYVAGDGDNLLFKTKLDAEKWARDVYPSFNVEQRYAMVRYKIVYSYDKL